MQWPPKALRKTRTEQRGSRETSGIDMSSWHIRGVVRYSRISQSKTIDFEIVRFNKLLYSGACPEQGEKDGKVPGKGNITPEELSQVLHGYRPATARILETLSPMVARRLNAHQHRGRHCPIARFVLWNSFGVHGFGSQLQALRIGLSSPTLTLSTSVRAPRSTPTQAPA